MNHQIQHRELMNRWAALPHHVNRRFICDGMIDPDLWEKAPRKVLFLLREAYGTANEEYWDLCRVIREEWKGPRHKIWWTAASWAYLAHHGQVGAVPRIPDERVAYAAATRALLGSAVVNVKKSDGKSTSDRDEIATYGQRDGMLIREQVGILSPRIVIYGNTWAEVRHLWPDAVEVFDGVWTRGGVAFIDFWHPANQFPNCLNYYALACLLQNSGIFQTDPCAIR